MKNRNKDTMKIKEKILVILSMVLLLTPGISFSKGVKLELERPVLPVLVKKQINPTVKGTLIREDNHPYIIR